MKQLLLPACLAMVLLVCCMHSKENLFCRKMKAQVVESVGESLRISDLTGFDWDTLSILTPYTPVSDLQKKSPSFRYRGKIDNRIEKWDNINLFLFTLGDSIVFQANCPRKYFDVLVEKRNRFCRKEAVFSVSKQDKQYIIDATN